MNSTITTSLNAITTTAFGTTLTLLVTLTLLTLLIQKEITSVSQGVRGQRLNNALNIVILPLLFAFIVITVVQVSKVL